MRDANGTPLDQAQATQAFARIVREVFFGESWETIEPYAERVWAYTLQSEGVFTGAMFETTYARSGASSQAVRSKPVESFLGVSECPLLAESGH